MKNLLLVIYFQKESKAPRLNLIRLILFLKLHQ